MNAIQKLTKGTSKAQRRKKAKQRHISLANGDAATEPRTRGVSQPAEDARKVATEARVRVFGIKRTIKRKATEEAADPMCGSGVGMCIRHTIAETDRRKIWDTWQSLCASQLNYRTRILGMTGHPQGSAIAMQSEAMQADVSHTIDIRTPDERDAAAKRLWLGWQASIRALPVLQIRWAVDNALSGGIDGEGGDVWRDGLPTARGRNLVAGLVALANTTP